MKIKVNFEKPSSVRILPMDRKIEFRNAPIEEVQQDFFLNSLPYRKGGGKSGKYLFKDKGMKAYPGCIILFQYDNHIIASAKLTDSEKFHEPQLGDFSEDPYYANFEYSGAHYFEPSSILVFDPVTADEIKSIWPEFKGFSHAKYFLDAEKYPQFLQLVNKKYPKTIAEKINTTTSTALEL